MDESLGFLNHLCHRQFVELSQLPVIRLLATFECHVK